MEAASVGLFAFCENTLDHTLDIHNIMTNKQLLLLFTQPPYTKSPPCQEKKEKKHISKIVLTLRKRKELLPKDPYWR